MVKGSRSIKSIAALGFMLLAAAIVLIILDGPVAGYELSIYEGVPELVWFCILGSVAVGFWIGIRQALSQDPGQSDWWALGLLIVLLNNLTFLLLPVLRGYALYGREDVMTHVGYAVDIVTNGILPTSDFYPMLHLLVAILSEVSGLPSMAIAEYVVPLLSMLYVGFTYCLARFMFDDPRLIRVATLLSTVLLFSPMQYHSALVALGLGVFLIPLAVYTYARSASTPSMAFSVLAILVVGIVLPFIHPLVWLVLCVTLAAMVSVKNLLNRRKAGPVSQNRVRFGAVVISAVIFLSWFLNFYLADRIIRATYNRFFGPGVDVTMMDRVIQSADSVGYEWWDVAFLVVKIAGHDLIFLALGSLGGGLAVSRLLRGKFGRTERYLIVLLPAVLCPAFFFLLHAFATIMEFGILRLLTTTVACVPVFVSYLLLELDSLLRSRRSITAGAPHAAPSTILFVVLALLCWVLGSASTFGWSFIRQANQQATRMETAGVSWLVKYKDPAVSADLNKMISRFADGLYGTEWRTGQGIYRLTGITSPIGAFPDHFGYPEYPRLGQWFEQDVYLPISVYDKILHTTVFPEFGQFSQDDFEALFTDKTAHRVFSDGEFDVWYVSSFRPTDRAEE